MNPDHRHLAAIDSVGRPAKRRRGSVRLAAVLLAAGLATPSLAERPRVYAITGADVVPSPGRRIDGATVVIRDGLIDAVGAAVALPPDAVEIDGTDLFVYPGLIDADTGLGLQAERPGGDGGPPRSPFGGSRNETSPGANHPLSLVHPERQARDRLLPFEGDRKREVGRYRELGITTVLAAPDAGIFRGRSAVILLLDDAPVPELILRDDAASHIGLERGRFGQGYPTSLMGAAATIRQVMLDTRRHAEWSARWDKNPRGMPRPEQVAAFDALRDVVGRRQTVIFHADSPDDALLAHRLASEFELSAAISVSGHEWEIADRLAAAGRTLILPVAFPDKPKVDDEDEALDVSLAEMRRYLEAPAAARRLHEAGVRFAFTTRGLGNLADFRKNMTKIIDAGLPEDEALAAWTTVPAKLLGIEATTGTLERGKLANLVVTDGPLFGEKTKAKRIFVDGIEYEIKEKKKPKGDPNAVVDPRGEWSVVMEFGGRTMQRTWTITGERGNYSGTAETQAGTVSFDSVTLEGNMLTVVFPARGGRPSSEITVVITADTFEGSAEFGPRSVPIKGTRTSGPQGGQR